MKVYSPPAEVGPKPEFNYGTSDFREEIAKEELWVKKIKDYARKHGKGTNRGQEVDFPFADGQARYIVFTNTILIHLPVGDAWQYPYIERLRATDIAQKVKSQKAIRAIFS